MPGHGSLPHHGASQLGNSRSGKALCRDCLIYYSLLYYTVLGRYTCIDMLIETMTGWIDSEEFLVLLKHFHIMFGKSGNIINVLHLWEVKTKTKGGEGFVMNLYVYIYIYPKGHDLLKEA